MERVSGDNVSMNSKSYCSESTGAIQVENILAGGRKRPSCMCVCGGGLVSLLVEVKFLVMTNNILFITMENGG